MRTFEIDGERVQHDMAGATVLWSCTCADFLAREKALGESFCVHVARAIMRTKLEVTVEGQPAVRAVAGN